MMGKFLKRIFVTFLLLFSIGSMPMAHAYTDDARVLGGISSSTDIYAYLNRYPYHLWKSNHRYSAHDIYISNDNCVLVDVWDNRMGQIFLVGPGYKTDKGIEVGMNIQQAIDAYGPFVDSDSVNIDTQIDFERHRIGGIYYDRSRHATAGNSLRKLKNYYELEYVSKENEGLTFMAEHGTNKIVLIMYQQNRHGNAYMGSYVLDYGLLNFVKK